MVSVPLHILPDQLRFTGFLDTSSHRSKSTSVAKILVIDDEPSVLASIEQALKTAGHKITSAGGGSEAMRCFQEDPADLLITDLFMPAPDGIQLITHFRKQFPDVPIIAISGNPRGNMLDIAKKLGAVGAVPKPFSVEELLSAVNGALKT